MQLAFILGMDKNRGIGYQNQLPWHIPADFKHFKALTLGKPVLMGRKTYTSMGRPLPGRRNVVVTRDKNFTAPGIEVYYSPDAALVALADQEEVMMIGGAQLIKQLMPQAQRMYLTHIHDSFTVDVHFPEWDKAQWQVVSEEKHCADEKNPHAYTFVTYERLGR